MENKITAEIGDKQHGFMPDEGKRNAIYMKTVSKKRTIEMQQKLYFFFLDSGKTFVRVKHEKMLQMLKDINIDKNDIRIIQNLYYNQCASVRVGNSKTETINIKKGVGQGCVLLPHLFILYRKNILRCINDLEGIKAGGKNIKNIWCADHTELIATTWAEFQKLVTKVDEESDNMGMARMKIKRNAWWSSEKDLHKCEIQASNKPIKQTENFIYLWVICVEDVDLKLGQKPLRPEIFVDLSKSLYVAQGLTGPQIRQLSSSVI